VNVTLGVSNAGEGHGDETRGAIAGRWRGPVRLGTRTRAAASTVSAAGPRPHLPRLRLPSTDLPGRACSAAHGPPAREEEDEDEEKANEEEEQQEDEEDEEDEEEEAQEEDQEVRRRRRTLRARCRGHRSHSRRDRWRP
jgi:hypothetical protein